MRLGIGSQIMRTLLCQAWCLVTTLVCNSTSFKVVVHFDMVCNSSNKFICATSQVQPNEIEEKNWVYASSNPNDPFQGWTVCVVENGTLLRRGVCAPSLQEAELHQCRQSTCCYWVGSFLMGLGPVLHYLELSIIPLIRSKHSPFLQMLGIMLVEMRCAYLGSCSCNFF